MDGGQHAGNADAVGDEVGRVIGANHAFAQRAHRKSFQFVQHARLGGGRVDQFHQRHVARRVEKVDAAKTRLDGRGQRFAQRRDRQARCVAGHNGVSRNEGRDLVIQLGFPVHALGDGFDDQVAAAQHVHVLFVVGLLNQHRIIGHAQRRGFQLFQAVDGFGHNAVFGAFLCRKIKQDDRHADVDKMGGNLRPHHTSAEHGDFFHLKAGHFFVPCR